MYKVLVADDEELIRWSLSCYLESSGFSVDSFDNGTDVIRHLKNHAYDIIVTDLKMPGLTGTDILHTVKEMGIQLPVIVISAYFSDKLIDETLSNGAYECISKPFEMDHLLVIVKKALGNGSNTRQGNVK